MDMGVLKNVSVRELFSSPSIIRVKLTPNNVRSFNSFIEVYSTEADPLIIDYVGIINDKHRSAKLNFRICNTDANYDIYSIYDAVSNMVLTEKPLVWCCDPNNEKQRFACEIIDNHLVFFGCNFINEVSNNYIGTFTSSVYALKPSANSNGKVTIGKPCVQLHHNPLLYVLLCMDIAVNDIFLDF